MFAINQVKDILIVGEGDELPKDTLAFILILLKLEDILVELLLECLVGVVDTNLLKAVGLKRFKAKDIKDTNGSRDSSSLWVRLPRRDAIIDSTSGICSTGVL